MNEAKKNRIIVASTVGAVLLVLILVFILTYQLIAIAIAKNVNEEYKLAEQKYIKNINEAELTIDQRNGRTWVVCRAKELGYILPDSKDLNS